MATGEDNIKRADKDNDATGVAVAYADYADSMRAAGQTPKPLRDIVGHK